MTNYFNILEERKERGGEGNYNRKDKRWESNKGPEGRRSYRYKKEWKKGRDSLFLLPSLMDHALVTFKHIKDMQGLEEKSL